MLLNSLYGLNYDVQTCFIGFPYILNTIKGIEAQHLDRLKT